MLISLPEKPAPKKHFFASPSGKDERSKERLRVLIVEDEFLVALSIEEVAREANMAVVGVALNTEQALEICEHEQPDFVTMDIRLKDDENGMELAELLEKRYGLRSLFISAYVAEASGAPKRNIRPLGWVRKPFSPRELLAELQRAASLLKNN